MDVVVVPFFFLPRHSLNVGLSTEELRLSTFLCAHTVQNTCVCVCVCMCMHVCFMNDTDPHHPMNTKPALRHI